MSSRMSRPRRTRLYDCNYNMSERYYKPMVDHLDRKYSPGQTVPDIPRHFSPLADGYRRPERNSEEPRRRPMSAMIDDMETNSRANVQQYEDDAMSDEMASSMRRIQASRAARAAIEDEISEINALRSSRKPLEYSEKVLDSVGLNNSSISRARDALDDDTFFKKRTLKMTTMSEDDEDNNSSLTKWTAMKSGNQRIVIDDDTGSTAMLRARMSRNRLADLDAEMEQVADRAAARERRNNNLRAMVEENQNNSSDLSSSSTVRVKKTTVKAEKKTVTF